MSRWRAGVLIAVHLLIIAHAVHWLATGKTVSPIEPSEAMYTLNRGELNAGFVFFAAAILATLVLGRFVCGWGCHFIAYQDLCNWLLKKIGIRPKPLRSRLLVFAPMALAIYMFVWPSAFRWWMGGHRPQWTNHLTTNAFWATFPGPGVTVLTVLLAGCAIVYFLGAKGFCTYACPYGGFFGLADKFAAGRILVTDACKHCGHCTSACTSNVKVHEEVALYGMVVDPGCMKCMDCISVCPNDALYYGFTSPLTRSRTPTPHPRAAGFSPREASESRGLTPDRTPSGTTRAAGFSPRETSESRGLTPDRTPSGATRAAGFSPRETPDSRGLTPNRTHPAARRSAAYDFTLAEELLMIAIGILSLLALRGLYGLIPLLLAMALAAMTAYVTVKLWRLARDANVRLQNLQLRRGSRIGRSGLVFAAVTIAWIGVVVHSGVIQWSQWRGQSALRSLRLPDEVWSAGSKWSDAATPAQVSGKRTATIHLKRADAWGLLETPVVLEDLIWVYLADGRDSDAEQTVRRLIRHRPDDATLYGALATILTKAGNAAGAEQACRDALAQDPTYRRGREQLIELLKNQRRIDETATLYRDAINLAPEDPTWRLGLAQLYVDAHRPADARVVLESLLASSPDSAHAHSMLGVCLLALGESDAGLSHLQRAVDLEPDSGKAQFNLGMAYLELRRVPEALPWLQQATQLNPDFAPGHYNLGVATYMTGHPREALPHIQEAIRLAPDDADAQGFLKVLLDDINRIDRSPQSPTNDN